MSPGPAASSSTRCPGWSASCSIIHADTGMPQLAHARRRACPSRRPPRSQRSTISARCASGSAAHAFALRSDSRRRDLAERPLDLRAQPLLEDRHQRLGGDRPQPLRPPPRSPASARRHVGLRERLPHLAQEQLHERRARPSRSGARSPRAPPARCAARSRAGPPPRRPPAATGSGPRTRRRRPARARRASAPWPAPRAPPRR